MKWHIVGSDGYIAGKILARLPQNIPLVKYSPVEGAGDVQFDLTALTPEVFSNLEAGDYVVFLAAISSPDVCENQYDLAYAINITGTKQFIRECLQRKAKVLFFSSDVVNGGTENVHNEDAQVQPFGRYGAMKYAIEQEFCKEKNFKTFRLSYVFSAQDKFMKYICSCAEKNEEADVYHALFRNVIYVEDIIDGIVALADSFNEWDNYLFNLSGPDLLSRVDLAQLYQSNINAALQYKTSIPSEDFFRARPNTIATTSKYLEKLLGRPVTPIAQAMKREFH